MTQCIIENLFGVAKPYVKDIDIGDYCLLYNYSDKNVYGIWKAASECGIHNPKAWGGRFKFQVRVRQVSKTYTAIPIDKLKSILVVGSEITWKYFGDKAQLLIQYFASDYSNKIKTAEELTEYEEDYRKKYPRNYHCEDGHDVRSLSEQTIDNWLYKKRIPHAYEPVIGLPEKLIPDFVIPSEKGETVYIEFWGMLDDPVYKNRMYKKSQIYAKYNMQLIELRPNDLQNFDFVFTRKLQSKNVM